jgi:hypothetical protein
MSKKKRIEKGRKGKEIEKMRSIRAKKIQNKEELRLTGHNICRSQKTTNRKRRKNIIFGRGGEGGGLNVFFRPK